MSNRSRKAAVASARKQRRAAKHAARRKVEIKAQNRIDNGQSPRKPEALPKYSRPLSDFDWHRQTGMVA